MEFTTEMLKWLLADLIDKIDGEIKACELITNEPSKHSDNPRMYNYMLGKESYLRELLAFIFERIGRDALKRDEDEGGYK